MSGRSHTPFTGKLPPLKRFNRIINSFPFNRLSFFIEYKAHLKGIAVVKIKEDYTSKTCSRCGGKGKE